MREIKHIHLSGTGAEGFSVLDGALVLLADTLGGSYTLTATVKDAEDESLTFELTVLVVLLLTFNSPGVLKVVGNEREDDFYRFEVSGGYGKKVYDHTPALGFSVASDSGSLSYDGVGGDVGEVVVTVTVNDESDLTPPEELLLTVEVVAPLSAELSEGARDGVDSFVNFEGLVSEVEFSGVGGFPPYTFSLLANDNFGIAEDGENFWITKAFANTGTAEAVWVLEDSDTERTPAVTGTVQVQIRDALGFANNKPIVNVTVDVKLDRVVYTAKAQQDDNAGYRQIGKHTSFTVDVSNHEVGAVVSMISPLSEAMTATLEILVEDRGVNAILRLEVRAFDKFSAELPANFTGQTFEGESGELGVINVFGGSGDNRYSLIAPPGFEVDVDGALSIESPRVKGIYTLTVTVLDNELDKFGWTAVTVEATVSVATGFAWDSYPTRLSVLHGIYSSLQDTKYNFITLQVISGMPAYTFAAKQAPAWLSLLPDSNQEGAVVLRRLANDIEVGEYIFTVQAEDSYDKTIPGTPGITAIITLVVRDDLSMDAPSPAPIASDFAGIALTLSAQNGVGALSYAEVEDAAAYSVNSTTGEVYVDAAARGFTGAAVLTATLRATRAQQIVQTADVVLRVSVSAALDLSLEQLQERVGPGFDGAVAELSAAGGLAGEYIYSLGENADGGFTIVAGFLNLQADVSETGILTATVILQRGEESVSQVFVIEVRPPFRAPSGKVEVLINADAKLVAAGGEGDLIFSLINTDGAGFILLPDGTLQVGDIDLALYTLTVQVQDSNADIAVGTLTVETISPLSNNNPPTEAITLITDIAETAPFYNFRTSGGYGDRTYMFAAANGFSVDESSGALTYSGGATVGVTVLTVIADDESAATQPIMLPLTVEISANLKASLRLQLFDGTKLITHIYDGTSVLTLLRPTGRSIGEIETEGGLPPYSYKVNDEQRFSVRIIGHGTEEGAYLRLLEDTSELVTVEWTVEDGDERTEDVVGTVRITIRDRTAFSSNEVTLTVMANEAAPEIYSFVVMNDGAYSYQFDYDGYEIVGDKLNITTGQMPGPQTLTVRVSDAAMPSIMATIEVEIRFFNEVKAEYPPGLATIYAGDDGITLGTVKASGGTGLFVFDTAANAFGVDDNGVVTVKTATAGVHTLRVTVTDELLNDLGWTAATVAATVVVGDALRLVNFSPEEDSGKIETEFFALTGAVGFTIYAEVAGGEPPYKLVVEPMNYPLSLSLAAAADGKGQIGPNNQVIGNQIYVLTFRGEDSHMEGSPNIVAAFTLRGVESLAIMPPADRLTATAGVLDTFQKIAATGGVNEQVEFSTDDARFALSEVGDLSISEDAAAGLYTLTVVATDGVPLLPLDAAQTATMVATIHILQQLRLADASSLLSVIYNAPASLTTFTATGGHGAIQYDIIAGDAGDYFAVIGGTLSLVAEAVPGVYELRVEASDNSPTAQRVVAAVTVWVYTVALMAGEVPTDLLETDSSMVTLLHQFVPSGGYGEYSYALAAQVTGIFVRNDGELRTGSQVTAGLFTVSVLISDAGFGGAKAQQVTAVVSVTVAQGDSELSEVDFSLSEVPTQVIILTARAAVDNLHVLEASGHAFFEIVSVFMEDDDSLVFTEIAGRQGFAIDGGTLSADETTQGGLYRLIARATDDYGSTAEATINVRVWWKVEIALDPPQPRLYEGESGQVAKVNISGYNKGYQPSLLGPSGEYFAYIINGSLLRAEGNQTAREYTLTFRAFSVDSKNNLDDYALVGRLTTTITVGTALTASFESPGVATLTVYEQAAAVFARIIHSGGGERMINADLPSGFAVLADGGLSLAAAAAGDYELLLTVADDYDGPTTPGTPPITLSLVVKVAAGFALPDFPAKLTLYEDADFAAHYALDGGGAFTVSMVGDERFAATAAERGVALSSPSGLEVGVYTLSLLVIDIADKPTFPTLLLILPLTVAPALEATASRTAVTVYTDSAGDRIAVISAVGGKPPYSYSGNSSILDDNYFVWGVDGDAGVVSLTAALATEQGPIALRWRVVDLRGVEVFGTITVQVIYPSLAVATDFARLVVTMGEAGQAHQFSGNGGNGNYLFYLLDDDGDLAAQYGEFSLGEQSGILEVSDAATAGKFALTIALRDSESAVDGDEARLTVTVEVFLPPASGRKMYLMGGWAAPINTDIGALLEGGDVNLASAMPSNAVYSYDAASSISNPESFVALGEADWSPREFPGAVALADKMYVMGGKGIVADGGATVYFADVWSSRNGANWILETAEAWPARTAHGVLAHGGKIYVMGGEDEDGNLLGDVWSSADGKTWALAQGSPGWSARKAFAVASFGDLMYIIGGENADGTQKNVFSSADGIAWEEVGDLPKSDITDAADPERSYVGAIVKDRRLVVLGGRGNPNGWISPDGTSWDPDKLLAIDARSFAVASFNDNIHIIGGRWDSPGLVNGKMLGQPFRFGQEFRDPIIKNEASAWIQGGQDAKFSRLNADLVVFPPENPQLPAGVNLFFIGEIPKTLTVAIASSGALLTVTAAINISDDISYQLINEPNGLSINLSSGVISYDNLAVGEYDITIRSDSSNYDDFIQATVHLIALSLQATPPGNLQVIRGGKQSFSFSGFGGLPPYTFVLQSDYDESIFFLASTVDNAVILSVAGAPVGRYILTVIVDDAFAGTMPITLQAEIQVTATMLAAITPTLRLFAPRGQEFYQLVVSGGVMPYTYAAINGDSAIAVLSNGALRMADDADNDSIHTVTVRVTDGDMVFGPQTDDVVVSAQAIGPLLVSVTPMPQAGETYNITLGQNVTVVTLVADGGTGQKDYIARGFPSSFKLNEMGDIAHIATDLNNTPGYYTLTVEVSDQEVGDKKQTKIVLITVHVLFELRLPAPDLSYLQIGQPFAEFLRANGGDGNYTYSLVADDANLLSVSEQSGELMLSQTPAGIYQFTLAVRDGAGLYAESVWMLVIAANAPLAAGFGYAPILPLQGDEVNYGIPGSGGSGAFDIVKRADVSGKFVIDNNVIAFSSAGAKESGAYTITVRATDTSATAPQVNEAAITLRVVDFAAQTRISAIAAGVSVFLNSDEAGIAAALVETGEQWQLAGEEGDFILGGMVAEYPYQSGAFMVRSEGGEEGSRYVIADSEKGILLTVFRHISFAADDGNLEFTELPPDNDQPLFARVSGFIGMEFPSGTRFRAAPSSDAVLLRSESEFALTVESGVVTVEAHGVPLRGVAKGGDIVFAEGDAPVTVGICGSDNDRAEINESLLIDLRSDCPPLTSSMPKDEYIIADGLAGMTVTVMTLTAKDGINSYTYALDDDAEVFSLVVIGAGKEAEAALVLTQVAEGPLDYFLTLAVSDQVPAKFEFPVQVHILPAPVEAVIGLIDFNSGQSGYVGKVSVSGGYGNFVYLLSQEDDGARFNVDNNGNLFLLNPTGEATMLSAQIFVKDRRDESEALEVVSTVMVFLNISQGAPTDSSGRLFAIAGNAQALRGNFTAQDKVWPLPYVGQGNLPDLPHPRAVEFLPLMDHVAWTHPSEQKIYILGGNQHGAGASRNQVLFSDDAKVWGDFFFAGVIPWNLPEAMGGHRVLFVNNTLYLLGTNGQVWGTNTTIKDEWTRLNPGSNGFKTGAERRHFLAMTLYNEMYVMFGGRDQSDVSKSSDYGRTWELVTGDTGTGLNGRGLAGVVFKNRMYIMGKSSDVWSTTNGKNDWRLETSSAEFGNRKGHDAIVYDGRLWVVGGEGKADAWSSADGISWRREGITNNNASTSNLVGTAGLALAVVRNNHVSLLDITSDPAPVINHQTTEDSLLAVFLARGIGDNYTYDILGDKDGFAIDADGRLTYGTLDLPLGVDSITVFSENSTNQDFDNQKAYRILHFMVRNPPLELDVAWTRNVGHLQTAVVVASLTTRYGQGGEVALEFVTNPQDAGQLDGAELKITAGVMGPATLQFQIRADDGEDSSVLVFPITVRKPPPQFLLPSEVTATLHQSGDSWEPILTLSVKLGEGDYRFEQDGGSKFTLSLAADGQAGVLYARFGLALGIDIAVPVKVFSGEDSTTITVDVVSSDSFAANSPPSACNQETYVGQSNSCVRVIQAAGGVKNTQHNGGLKDSAATVYYNYRYEFLHDYPWLRMAPLRNDVAPAIATVTVYIDGEEAPAGTTEVKILLSDDDSPPKQITLTFPVVVSPGAGSYDTTEVNVGNLPSGDLMALEGYAGDLYAVGGNSREDGFLHDFEVSRGAPPYTYSIRGLNGLEDVRAYFMDGDVLRALAAVTGGYLPLANNTYGNVKHTLEIEVRDSAASVAKKTVVVDVAPQPDEGLKGSVHAEEVLLAEVGANVFDAPQNYQPNWGISGCRKEVSGESYRGFNFEIKDDSEKWLISKGAGALSFIGGVTQVEEYPVTLMASCDNGLDVIAANVTLENVDSYKITTTLRVTGNSALAIELPTLISLVVPMGTDTDRFGFGPGIISDLNLKEDSYVIDNVVASDSLLELTQDHHIRITRDLPANDATVLGEYFITFDIVAKYAAQAVESHQVEVRVVEPNLNVGLHAANSNVTVANGIITVPHQFTGDLLTLIANGGIEDYFYNFIARPDGFVVNNNSGLVRVNEVLDGPAFLTATVEVSDQHSASGVVVNYNTVTLTVEVKAPPLRFAISYSNKVNQDATPHQVGNAYDGLVAVVRAEGGFGPGSYTMEKLGDKTDEYDLLPKVRRPGIAEIIDSEFPTASGAFNLVAQGNGVWNLNMYGNVLGGEETSNIKAQLRLRSGDLSVEQTIPLYVTAPPPLLVGYDDRLVMLGGFGVAATDQVGGDEGVGTGFGDMAKDVWVLESTGDSTYWRKHSPYSRYQPTFAYGNASFNERIHIIGGRVIAEHIGSETIEGVACDSQTSRFYNGQSVCFNGNVRVHSADGVTWDRVSSELSENLNVLRPIARSHHAAAAHRGKLYVMGGMTYVAAEKVWQQTYNNNIDAGGRRNALNDVWAMNPNGSWDHIKGNGEQGFGKRLYHDAVSHNGKLYVFGGAYTQGALTDSFLYDDVWASGTGQEWTRINDDVKKFTPRFGHAVVWHEDAFYLVGGATSSELAGITPGTGFGLPTSTEAYKGLPDLFLNASNRSYGLANPAEILNDVWKSGDGVNWTMLTSNLPGPRAFHKMASLGGKLILSGGVESGDGWARTNVSLKSPVPYKDKQLGLLNEVWESSDGINWEKKGAFGENAAAMV